MGFGIHQLRQFGDLLLGKRHVACIHSGENCATDATVRIADNLRGLGHRLHFRGGSGLLRRVEEVREMRNGILGSLVDDPVESGLGLRGTVAQLLNRIEFGFEILGAVRGLLGGAGNDLELRLYRGLGGNGSGRGKIDLVGIEFPLELVHETHEALCAEAVLRFAKVGVQLRVEFVRGLRREFGPVACRNQMADEAGGIFFVGVPAAPLVSATGLHGHTATRLAVDREVAGGNTPVLAHEARAEIAQELPRVCGGQRIPTVRPPSGNLGEPRQIGIELRHGSGEVDGVVGDTLSGGWSRPAVTRKKRQAPLQIGGRLEEKRKVRRQLAAGGVARVKNLREKNPVIHIDRGHRLRFEQCLVVERMQKPHGGGPARRRNRIEPLHKNPRRRGCPVGIGENHTGRALELKLE